MSMNVELKAKWVEALRSGSYKQGKGRLRTTDNTFCCLGVLCDIIDATKWKLNNDYYYDERWDSAVVPSELRQRIKLDHKVQSQAMLMNDCGRSFAEIADMIERDA
jgi:hypothetical protein